MGTQLIGVIETTAIAVIGFMVKKYVFLEPDLEGGRQRKFYLASLFVTGLVFLLLGKDAASMAALVMIGINIALGRKKYRLAAIPMMLPLTGMVNGLLGPLLLVPPYLSLMSEEKTQFYQYLVYGGVFLLIGAFYIGGKKWRCWFEANMGNRKLRGSEKCLLWLVGILMMAYSSELAAQKASGTWWTGIGDEAFQQRYVSFMGISSIAVFFMAVMIVATVMQNNKRFFYHEQLAGMQSGMITLMAEIVENRDDNTGGHIRRTAAYVEQIAEELKRQGAYREILSEHYVSDMVVAAPLHDIGKIHIPDAVLNKPGRLDEEEFAIMKTHTTAGEELLKHAREELGESSYLNMAVEMAAYHHEWWNGKGYPYGISGEEIPLCARIMAVADVFDALTSKRCYKDAMPLEKAYAIIREESGTHFDPVIAEAFLRQQGAK